MPANAEVVEILARKSERMRMLNDLKECKNFEDHQELVKKYKILCANDKE